MYEESVSIDDDRPMGAASVVQLPRPHTSQGNRRRCQRYRERTPRGLRNLVRNGSCVSSRPGAVRDKTTAPMAKADNSNNNYNAQLVNKTMSVQRSGKGDQMVHSESSVVSCEVPECPHGDAQSSRWPRSHTSHDASSNDDNSEMSNQRSGDDNTELLLNAEHPVTSRCSVKKREHSDHAAANSDNDGYDDDNALLTNINDHDSHHDHHDDIAPKHRKMNQNSIHRKMQNAANRKSTRSTTNTITNTTTTTNTNTKNTIITTEYNSDATLRDSLSVTSRWKGSAELTCDLPPSAGHSGCGIVRQGANRRMLENYWEWSYIDKVD